MNPCWQLSQNKGQSYICSCGCICPLLLEIQILLQLKRRKKVRPPFRVTIVAPSVHLPCDTAQSPASCITQTWKAPARASVPGMHPTSHTQGNPYMQHPASRTQGKALLAPLSPSHLASRTQGNPSARPRA
jgi:hypothetical protein